MSILPLLAGFEPSSEYEFEYELQLFVAGASPRAEAALRNI